MLIPCRRLRYATGNIDDPIVSLRERDWGTTIHFYGIKRDYDAGFKDCN